MDKSEQNVAKHSKTSILWLSYSEVLSCSLARRCCQCHVSLTSDTGTWKTIKWDQSTQVHLKICRWNGVLHYTDLHLRIPAIRLLLAL